MGRRPRTGVTGVVSLSDLNLIKGVGRRARAVVRGSRTLVNEGVSVLTSIIVGY